MEAGTERQPQTGVALSKQSEKQAGLETGCRGLRDLTWLFDNKTTDLKIPVVLRGKKASAFETLSTEVVSPFQYHPKTI